MSAPGAGASRGNATEYVLAARRDAEAELGDLDKRLASGKAAGTDAGERARGVENGCTRKRPELRCIVMLAIEELLDLKPPTGLTYAELEVWYEEHVCEPDGSFRMVDDFPKSVGPDSESLN